MIGTEQPPSRQIHITAIRVFKTEGAGCRQLLKWNTAVDKGNHCCIDESRAEQVTESPADAEALGPITPFTYLSRGVSAERPMMPLNAKAERATGLNLCQTIPFVRELPENSTPFCS